ncbi:hypothetical protein QFC22_003669 [Naganishia vaughanmartiniae]|uniref:Uncharacterized protein n=1 Tax=Naganishia vaughanmartiniae TaxID=1424756 RepID=A0ACC2X8S7_9TREE|nr:hypothetical protein QFC22_003669 [Naganishia vaughanmartiniae]
MAMFGERSSESPRLPSPWQQALATPSPAISIISHNSIDFETSSPASRNSARYRRSSGSSLALRTPSQLSLSATSDEPDDSAEIDSSTSLTSTSAFQRLRSSGVSENLILHLAQDYAASTSTSTSASFGQSARALENARPGVSGGLAGVGYEGIKLIAERDKIGHIEYKLRLLPSGPERFERLTTQLKWRLQEGGGQAVYEIGVLDDGTLVGITYQDMDRSLETLELMAAELGATVMVLRTITLANPPPFPKALMAYDGGESEDEPDCEGSQADELGAHRQIKKKKSPKKSKKKTRSSVDRMLDDQHSPRIPGTGAYTPGASLSDSLSPEHHPLPEDTILRSSEDPAEYYERARRKCEAKMARRRVSGGFPSHELSGKQRKAWGSGKADSIWDGYGDSDVDSAGQVPAESNCQPSGDMGRGTVDPCEVLSPPSPVQKASPTYGPAITESWRARNMARAIQQDNTRWHHKPALSPQERDIVRQARKSRKALKDQQAWMSDRSQVHHPEILGNRGRSSESSNGQRSGVEVDDEGLGVFNFDAFSRSESEGDSVTHEALAALETASSIDTAFFDQSYGEEVPSASEIDMFVPTKRPKKIPKKRRVRVQRAEERRLDLLRGDGTGADGMPLFMDSESAAMGTDIMTANLEYAISDREDDDTNAISSVVRRLVGDTNEQPSPLAYGVAKQVRETAGVDICTILSTSPTYTIKPTSPSAQHLFSLPFPSSQAVECDFSPPSPSNTITMPLDNLSLSFSHCELCTTVCGAVTSTFNENAEYALSDKRSNEAAEAETAGKSASTTCSAAKIYDLDLSNARLCVEALIVKKMDMDDRYLDFSGFIL